MRIELTTIICKESLTFLTIYRATLSLSIKLEAHVFNHELNPGNSRGGSTKQPPLPPRVRVAPLKFPIIA